MERAMRLVFALIVVLSADSAFAQGNQSQPTRPVPAEPQTTGQGSRLDGIPEAPIGHLQPRAADLPPEVRGFGATPTPAQQEFDKKLRICRGC
jgi:hypothetical protein